MELTITTSERTNGKAIVTAHKGETIQWDGGLLTSTKFDRVENMHMFNIINQYWAQLPEEKQDKIFSIYKDICSKFNTSHYQGHDYTAENIIEEVREGVLELIEQHPLSDITRWAKFNSGILIPSSIKAEMDTTNHGYTAEKTYLRSQYYELAMLVIGMRILIPIYGEFIARINRDIGTSLKEYYAFGLMSGSEYDECNAMEKLRVYVGAMIPSENNKKFAASLPGLVMEGISTDMLPEWLLAVVVVRRLCIGNLQETTDGGTLITSISGYLTRKIDSLQTHLSPVAKNMQLKRPPTQGADEEGKISVYESYRQQHKLSAGDIEIGRMDLANPKDLALLIDPNVDLKILKEFMKTSKEMENFPLMKPQRWILKFILRNIISPAVFEEQTQMYVINAVIAVQAVLWTKGYTNKEFQKLALLLSAEAVKKNDAGAVGQAKITNDLLEKLNHLYPYQHRPKGRRKIYKPENNAVNNIHRKAEEFAEYIWRVTVSDELTSSVTGHYGTKEVLTPAGIRNILAEMVISFC